MKKISCVSFILISIAFGTLFFNNNIAYACSGGSPLNLPELLNQSDYLVKAQATEIDDAGQNTIIRVESYISGGAGSEFLLLVRHYPVVTDYLLQGRSGGGDCLGLWQSLDPTLTFYAFLSRNEDGSFSAFPITTSWEYLVSFSNSTDTVEVYVEGNSQIGVSEQLTETEFLSMVQAESGETPVTPLTSSFYPLKSPLLISTTDGQYILPVDWQPPYAITEDTFALSNNNGYRFGFWEALQCDQSNEHEYSISPDGHNIAVVGENNTICFTWGHSVTGEAVLFSQTSDAIAVWDDCQLSIYTTGYPRLGQEWYAIELVSSTSLSGENCQQFYEFATWSSDGRLLAFADADGMHIWDVFTFENPPEIIIGIEADQSFMPLFFSAGGRYLNYSNGEINQYFDLQSGAIFDDGVISPDERILIRFDTTKDLSEYEICSLTPFYCYNSPPISLWFKNSEGELERFYDLSLVNEVIWRNNSSFIVFACTNDNYDRCALGQFRIGYSGWENTGASEAIAFDLEDFNDTIAVVYDTTIVIDSYRLDISQWVDGELTNVEWLPSLFYSN